MIKIIAVAALAVFVSFCFLPSATAGDKWAGLVEECGKVLEEVQKMPDKGIPSDLLRGCAGVAIFPSTVSAGFVFGGQYGQGVIVARDPDSGKWLNPAVFTLVGGSVGWQIGGQATDYVLVITNRRSIDGILHGKFKLGADAAVAAGPVGRETEASTDIQLKGGILSYSRSRGLFAGLKLEGVVIAQHRDANKALYGQPLSATEIMMKSQVPLPDSASGLIKLLNKYPYKK